MVARSQGTNGASHQACSRNRHQPSDEKDSFGGVGPVKRELPGSVNAPDLILQKNNNFRIIVIKKLSRKMDLSTGNHNTMPGPIIKDLMTLAREKEEGCNLEVVFREWELGSTALPTLPLVPSLSSHLPWVYMANPWWNLDKHIFGNMTTRQSILVANSDLQSSLLYSSDGWLLFQGGGNAALGLRFPGYPIFLLNPTTGVRIDLPSFHFSGHAAFCTTTQGTPGTVIFANSKEYTVKVYMVQPGDSCWEEYPCDFRLGPVDHIEKMVLCGSSVYCFLSFHCLVFNITDLCWHVLTLGSCKLNFLHYGALELEGEVVMVGNPEYLSTAQFGLDSIPFFRMKISGDEFEWVDITGWDEGLNGCIWFIHSLQSFCVKVNGSVQKICWFARRVLDDDGHLAYAVHCLNLTTRAHCRLTADSFICYHYAWVNLGSSSDYSLLNSGINGDDLLPGF